MYSQTSKENIQMQQKKTETNHQQQHQQKLISKCKIRNWPVDKCHYLCLNGKISSSSLTMGGE